MFNTALKWAVLTTATTAMSATGLILGAPAQAAPCDQYGLPLLVKEASGWSVVIPGSGLAASGRATAVDPRGQSKQGTASGSISGSHIDVTIGYDNGQFQRYVGDIDNAGNASGVTQNNIAKESNIAWSSESKLQCISTPKPSTATGTATNPGTGPVVQAAPTVTVTADVDFYDNPHGDGDPLGFLPAGKVVTVKKPCTPNAFCALADGTYAYGEFLENN